MAFNLEKLKDNNAIFWTFQWPKIREVAAECGWAVFRAYWERKGFEHFYEIDGYDCE